MPFKEIVTLPAENDVTAVPVVDDTDRPMGWCPRLIQADWARAEELMQAPAVCAHPEWSVVGRPV